MPEKKVIAGDQVDTTILGLAILQDMRSIYQPDQKHVLIAMFHAEKLTA